MLKLTTRRFICFVIVLCICVMFGFNIERVEASEAYTQVMSSDEFIGYLKTALNRSTKYNNEYPYNVGYYDGTYISWDCWHLGETIIATRGQVVNNYTVGAKASAWTDKEIGLTGQSGDWLKSACGDTLSSDFSSIIPGEWLFRDRNGSCYHVGYYIGNQQVIEITSDGDKNVQLTTIDPKGHSNLRSSSWTWTYHGKVPWISYTGEAYLTISGETYPTGSYTKDQLKNGFILKGLISSNPKLTNVSAKVINTATGQAVAGFDYSINPNSGTYDIRTDGLDKAFAFKNLPIGNYRYLVTAENANVSKILISSYFSVEDGSTYPAVESSLSINPVSTSYTITQGSKCSVTGSIDSNYNITSVTASLDGKQYVNLTPNAKTVDIGNSKSGQINSFKGAELSVGTHYIVINATDASSKSVTKTITITVTSSSGTITYPDIPNTPNIALNGQDVTVVWNDVYNETGYDVYLLQAPWGWEDIKYSASVDANITTYTFSNVAYGDYAAFVISRPNNNTAQSGWNYFSVAPRIPEKPAFIGLTGDYWNGIPITFQWNSTLNTTHYNFWLYKKNSGGEYEAYEHTFYVTSGFQRTLPVGEYRALVQSYNSESWKPDHSDWEYTESDYSYFNVVQAEITYNPNGGTGAPAVQPFVPGGGYYLSTEIPTCEGYTFVNWRDEYNGNYYNPGDPIPAAWGSNTLVAQWHPNMYYLDVNGWIDGVQAWDISNCGTFDLYINGGLDSSNISDKSAQWPYASTYEIKNIKPFEGYSFDGIRIVSEENAFGYPRKARTGLITENTSVELVFHTCPTSIDEKPEPVVFNGHTYYYFSTPVTWYDAKSICEGIGGHLATITSYEENCFVYSLTENLGFWIGATDSYSEGNWQWIDGEPFEYSNWGPGEPNNENSPYNYDSSENYLMIMNSECWNDSPGYILRPFVCEIDLLLETINNSIIKNENSDVEITEDVVMDIQSNITVADFKSNFENADKLRLFKADGKTELLSGVVGTGYVLKLMDGDTVLDEKVLVVPGDNSGDGMIDVVDVKLALNVSLGKQTLGGAFNIASNVNNDDVIDVVDVKLILNVSLGKQKDFKVPALT